MAPVLRNYQPAPGRPQAWWRDASALLDVSRFLRFVTKCGAEQSWLPIEGDDLQDLIGLAETRKEDKARSNQNSYSV